MAMVLGDATCAAGLSKRVHDALISAFGEKFDADDVDGKALAFAVASAVYTILTTDATVMPTLLVAPSGGGAVTGTGTIV
jgi:hypothetical protein